MLIELTSCSMFKVFIKKILAILFQITGCSFICRFFISPCITIVAYHRIISKNDLNICPYISVTEDNLINQIRYFKKKYSIISLEEAVERLSSKNVDKNYIVLTFDDGYFDNYSLGVSIFRNEEVNATVFVTTRCVEKNEMLWPDVIRILVYGYNDDKVLILSKWDVRISANLKDKINGVGRLICFGKSLNINDRKQFLEELSSVLGGYNPNSCMMLCWEQVKMLSQSGVTIGSHTVNHPILSKINNTEALFEVQESKRLLELKTGKNISFFAYPNGTSSDYTPETIQLLKNSGYIAAVTTSRGVNRPGQDLFQLRRTGVYLTDSLLDIKFKFAIESLLN